MRRVRPQAGLEVEVRQTNPEGDMLDWLNAVADDGHPVVLNAAAWTHYSYAIFDACAAGRPAGGGAISDPHQRPEEFRHTSVVTPYAARGRSKGHGIDGYRMALEVIARSRECLAGVLRLGRAGRPGPMPAVGWEPSLGTRHAAP